MAPILTVIGFGILFGGCGCGAASAREYVPVPVRVANEGATPVLCTADLAHWYTAVFLTVRKGTTGQAFILSDPASGTVYLLNEKRTPLPVEQILCGHAGGAMAALRLARKLGLPEQPIRLVCDDAGCGGD